MRSVNTTESISWPVIVGLAIAVWGVLLYQPGIESQRPVTPRRTATQLSADQPIARLWQDPLDTVLWANEDEGRLNESVVFPPDAVHSPLLVIPILVPGTPFVEDMERRLRTRYALQSAMAEAGMLPADHEYLRVVAVTAKGEQSPLGACGNQLIIPYEWFQYKEEAARDKTHPPPNDWALVLWLDDTLIDSLRTRGGSQSSIEIIDFIVTELFGAQPSCLSPTVRVLGPTSSDRLASILEQCPHDTSRWLKVFSPWATYKVDDAQSDEDGDQQVDENTEISLGPNAALVRTSGTDDDLCEALVEELQRRRAIPRSGGIDTPFMVLIGEWDTHYGRSLRKSFHNALEPYAIGHRVLEYGYLRGLDGELRSRRRDEELQSLRAIAATQGGSMPGLQSSESPNERAENRHQIDYIIRLANELKRNRRDIQAVGIFGTDVYDKMLLLRTLKQALPDAVFFTTDLDARLARRSEYRSTRNLVIASHFDLAFQNDEPDEGPKFEARGLSALPRRSSYDTAAFVTLLRILNVNESPDDETRWEHPNPRLYEIGARGPVALDVPHHRGKAAVLWLVPAAMLVSALGIFARRACFTKDNDDGDSDDRRPWPHLGRTLLLTMGATATVSLALVVAVWIIDTKAAEPLRFVEGVSAWPSIAIRAVAMVLAAWYCWRVIQDLASFDRMIMRQYLERALLPPRPFDLRWLGGLVGQACNPQWRVRFGITGYPERKPRENKTTVNGSLLFLDYLRRSRWKHRFERTAPFVLGAMVLAICLFAAFGLPRAPTRGWMSTVAHWSIFFGCVFTINVLSFLVIDAALLATCYVRALRKATTTYPAGVRSPIAPANLDKSLAAATIDIEIVTELTRLVSGILKYPFVILLLLAVATMPIFDAWPFSIASFIAFGLSAMIAMFGSVLLSRAAQRTRDSKVEAIRFQLADDRVAAAATKRPSKKHERAMLAKQVLSEVQERYSRHFLPFYQLPIVTSVLLPVGGIGVLQFLKVTGMVN